MKGHLVGFESMEDFEESPMKPFEIMDNNARFQSDSGIVDYLKMLERESKVQEKITTKKTIIRTYWRTR